MTWYDREVVMMDCTGRLIGRYEDSTTSIELTFDDDLEGQSIVVFKKTYQTMLRETPSEEEVINRFGAKLIRLERMLKELTKFQILKKRTWI